ncbi:MAG: hypothetical protein H0X66_22600 [Verrucomicrobia bacterium]|nr:hypothetical protein [Verrucomicrobiota bacterium]
MIVSEARLYFLLIYAGTFVDSFLTFGTVIPAALFVGLFNGGILAVFNFGVFYLLWMGLKRFKKEPKWSSRRSVTGLAVVIALCWVAHGVYESRPEQRFRRIFFEPLPDFIRVIEAKGASYGIDGGFWAFTCRSSLEQSRSYLIANGFKEVADSEQPEYWRRRVSWFGLKWELEGDYEVYLREGPGRDKRWAVIEEKGQHSHFVFSER